MDRQVAAGVLGNRMLARAELAYGAFNLADWVRWIAIVVSAFDRGGAAEAGVISLVQSVAAACVAPFAASLGDRWSRSGMLLVGYLAQAGALAAIAEGEVEFSIDGEVVGDATPGAFFGEIALLRIVPRTATVTALTAVRAYALEREPFLEALTGTPRANEAAQRVAAARLGS